VWKFTSKSSGGGANLQVDTLSVLTGSPAGSGWEAILAISTGGGAFGYKDRDSRGKVSPTEPPYRGTSLMRNIHPPRITKGP
jgi:hypothetical protein